MLSEPCRIGRFEVKGILGRGMTGVVYEAHDPVLTRTVALKTIDLAMVGATDDRSHFTRRFETEARIAARLHHPNIVVVHDVGRDPDTGILYIALERLPGETFARVLEEGVRLPWRSVLEAGQQIADALDHAHAQGVVHRDIKPANVMRLPDGSVKLMDFGIAKVEAGQLTAAGQFFGTPLYMSPEQTGNVEVDSRADIFSLGSVLYTLLTGRHAFQAETILGILQKVTREDPPAPGTLVPDLPHGVDDVVARCLAKSPDERYPSARLLAGDLGDILAGRLPRHAPLLGEVSAEPAGDATSPIPSPHFLGTDTVTVEPDSDPLAHVLDHEAPIPSPAPIRGRRRPGRRTAWAGAVAAVLALGGAVFFSSDGIRPETAPAGRPGDPVGQGAPAAEPARAVVPPEAGSEGAPVPTPLPARVVVDYRHPLRRGTLRVVLDDDAVLSRSVRGGVSRNLLVAKLHGGVVTDLLEVEPGRHEFEVVVSWDDQTRSQRIRGVFESGETYRLEVRLGRLRRNLSLEWTR